MNDTDLTLSIGSTTSPTRELLRAVATIAGSVELSGGRVVAVYVEGTDRPWLLDDRPCQ